METPMLGFGIAHLVPLFITKFSDREFRYESMDVVGADKLMDTLIAEVSMHTLTLGLGPFGV